MNLAELRQEVYTITNRPDLVAQTLTAIRSATLKLHQLDYWYKDITESGISFVSAEYLQQIDYRTLFPQWRALKYLRKTDVVGFDDGVLFKIISIPEQVEDQYNLNQSDVCYVAGDVVQIKSSTKFQYAMLGYYKNPIVTEAGYNSWMAKDHPYAIVFSAASSVFKMIGDTDQFSAYTRLAAEEFRAVQVTNVQAVGY